MKAIICTRYGSPDVLQYLECKNPIPKSTELLIKVHATTVNRTDCAILRAKPFLMRLFYGLFKPKHSILGTEFSGEVVAIGNNVKNYTIGDRVFGFNDNGLQTHAQFLIIAEDKELTTIPKDISYHQAAASCEGLHYAYNFINKVAIKNGQTVLVNGASGGIGSAAVQLLKAFGANVTAVTSTKNIELVKSLGADKVLDYTQVDFTKQQQLYFYVFDTVGKSSFAKCKPILHANGIYISSELGFLAQNIFFALMKPVIGNKKVVFPFPSNIKASLQLVKSLMEKSEFVPVIDKLYSLKQIAEAYHYVEKGHKIGNVVITTEAV